MVSTINTRITCYFFFQCDVIKQLLLIIKFLLSCRWIQKNLYTQFSEKYYNLWRAHVPLNRKQIKIRLVSHLYCEYNPLGRVYRVVYILFGLHATTMAPRGFFQYQWQINIYDIPQINMHTTARLLPNRNHFHHGSNQHFFDWPPKKKDWSTLFNGSRYIVSSKWQNRSVCRCPKWVVNFHRIFALKW